MINSFRGKYNFLSNFYKTKIFFEGNYYDSIEHAFQASKSLNDTIRKQFREKNI